MLIKLTTKLEALIAEGKIKTKWSEIEDYGISELVHIIFDYDPDKDSFSVTAAVENRTVCLDLYEGISYEHEGVIYTIIRAYINAENNIIFAATSGDLFMYETDVIDAEDQKHYCVNE